MALLNTEYSEVMNFIAIRRYLDLSKGIINTCNGYINKTLITYSQGDTKDAEHSNEDILKSKIGDFVEKVKRYTNIVTTLTKHIGELTELMKYCVDHIKYYSAKYLIKEIQLLGLRIKAIVVNIKIKIAQALRQVLVNILHGKAAAITNALVAAIILKVQVIGQLIGVALAAIDSLLNMLPPMITVKPHTMAFFPTPKSMSKVDLVPINTNRSICERLPEPVNVAIREAVKITDKLNVPIKLAIVAACAASGIAQASSKSHEFNIIGCKRINLIDPKKIIKAIEFIVALIPIPQALPKYEKISIINLGYLAWLLTTFEFGGKRSFGMMGMP